MHWELCAVCGRAASHWCCATHDSMAVCTSPPLRKAATACEVMPTTMNLRPISASSGEPSVMTWMSFSSEV